MSSTSVVSRGYVLIRPSAPLPSAVVAKAEALRMQRKFGGQVVSAEGLRARRVNGFRVIAAVDMPELKRRLTAGEVLSA